MSELKGPIIVGVVVAVAIALSVAGVVYLASPSSNNLSSAASTIVLSSTASTTTIEAVSLSNTTSFCTYPGGSGEVYLRVISDSNSTPVAGAVVSTSREFSYTCVPGANVASTTSQAYESFTTTSTEWHAFGGLNEGTFAFSVQYGGQTYDLTASQRTGPVSTCVTLHIPSGAIDITYVNVQMGQSYVATES